MRNWVWHQLLLLVVLIFSQVALKELRRCESPLIPIIPFYHCWSVKPRLHFCCSFYPSTNDLSIIPNFFLPFSAAFLVVAFRVFLQFPFQLAMCFALWAYVAFFSLLSVVYAAPRFNARAGSDEGSPSEPPNKKIKLEPGTQAVKQESPAVKAESPAVKAESPAVKAESPAVKAESPAVKAESPAVKAESPAVKAESFSPPPMNPREVVHISFIDKGKLKGQHWFPFEQRDKDLLEALIRRAARETWSWTEGRIQNMAFEYPDQTHHYTGIMKRYFFKGPFKQCGERDDEECIAEIVDFYDKQDPPRGEGSIYLRKRGVRGFIGDKGDKIFQTPYD
ncbi:uncharacterized protein C8R40DRAFT_831646 [Lentinula edodes]|uniref:uncharacterized protein n=1 Tax=Lentinula edodes TaxID=5353 RepID=UPI001E8D26D0|nr:uncharacterized protein C8R40DRAFT_831646 [Lentinula edodes]KAH7878209.1 hypothetical protein C8R40DRAFT_831646 [Lentinula edodes]